VKLKRLLCRNQIKNKRIDGGMEDAEIIGVLSTTKTPTLSKLEHSDNGYCALKAAKCD
jgi:hypothetical protein